jgi:hypothetical protein
LYFFVVIIISSVIIFIFVIIIIVIVIVISIIVIIVIVIVSSTFFRGMARGVIPVAGSAGATQEAPTEQAVDRLVARSVNVPGFLSVLIAHAGSAGAQSAGSE